MSVKHPVAGGIICLLSGTALFLVTHTIGNRTRPVPAVGGELLLAFLPAVIYFLLVPIVRDFLHTATHIPGKEQMK